MPSVINSTPKPPSGWKKEPLKFKHYSHEKIYGAATAVVNFIPIGRDISDIPVVYQGNKNTCVASTVTWIKQYLDKQKGSVKPLSQEYLAQISDTKDDGATPDQVLNTAKNDGICESELWLKEQNAISGELAMNAATHKIDGYAYINNLSASSLYQALQKEPLMIGVDDYMGSGPHMIGGFEITEDGSGIKCANWWKENTQDVITIPWNQVRFAASILTVKPVGNVSFSPLEVLLSKWNFVALWKKAATSLVAVLMAAMGIHAPSASTPQANFGAAGTYDCYATTLSGSGQSTTDNTLTVSSLMTCTGETITSSNLHFPVYLTINPNSRSTREVEECGSLSGSTFSGCSRQISSFCDTATSTVQSNTGTSGAFPHAAGEAVIMSNNVCFFNRLVDTYTDQSSVSGTKTFIGAGGVVKIGDSTTSTCKFVYFPNGQTRSPYFKVCGPTLGQTTSTFYFSQDGSSDLQLNTSGTTAGAASNGGLNLTNGNFSISVSSTGGIATDTTNLVYVNASSSPSTNGGFLKQLTTGLKQIYFDAISFVAGNWTWSGNNQFTGTVGLPNIATSTISDSSGVNFTSLEQLMATGTAGMPIVAGNALFLSTTGTVFVADSGQTTTTYPYIGLAQSNTSRGQTVLFVRPGGIARGLSSLSPSNHYFLSTSGAIATTPGTVSADIGVALSSTTLQLVQPTFYQVKSGSSIAASPGQASTTIALGFIPSKINFYFTGSNPTSADVGQTSSTAWNTNLNFTWQLNNDGTSSTAGGLNNSNFISTTTKGFIYRTNISTQIGFWYTAEYSMDGKLLN